MPDPSVSQSGGPCLKGWRLVGTGKWWPVMWGDPPQALGLIWEPIYA